MNMHKTPEKKTAEILFWIMAVFAGCRDRPKCIGMVHVTARLLKKVLGETDRAQAQKDHTDHYIENTTI